MEQRQGRKILSKNKNILTSLSDLAGRSLPHAVDFECSILGAMMLEKNAVTDTIDILRVESFHDPRNGLIYKAIRDLFGSSQPIDILTVAEQLRRNGEMESVGSSYLSSLTLRVTSTTDIETHAVVILQKYMLRRLIRTSHDILEDAYDDTKDVFHVLDKAGDELFQIAENVISKSVEPIGQVVQKAIREIETASSNKDGISGVPTGFFDLDKVTAGWQPSDMIVIAARPGMGKTAFVLSMARNVAAVYKMGVVVFSLEMSSIQLVKRLIASETQISAEKIRKGSISDQELSSIHEHVSNLKDAPLYIDDTPGLSVFDLRAKCRRLKKQHDIKLIIIDYLQLMNAGTSKMGQNREQEISTISRSIKEIAKELNIPIIALSQLSRSVELRGGDKKPILSDLRESGAIEQDADIVSFIYRPEYYGNTTDETGESLLGIGEFIIAKHRNGSLGTIRLQFIPEFAKFQNIDHVGHIHTEQKAFPSTRSQTVTYASKMDEIDDFDMPVDPNDRPF